MALDDNGGAGAGDAGTGSNAGGAAGAGDLAAMLTGGAGAAAAAGSGAGDAGAGAGGQGGDAGAGGGDAGAGGAADPDWYEKLGADPGEGESASNRDWIKAKGFKDIDAVAKALRSAEKAIHDSGRVKIPGENATDAEKAAFRQAMGVPEDAKGYEIAPIKDAEGNEVPLNTPLLERLANKAHEIGVPKATYEALVNDFVQSQIEMVQASDIEAINEGKAWATEQGSAAPAKLAAINRAAKALGLSNEEVFAIRGAIGARRQLDIFSKLGEGIGEDMLIGDGGGKWLVDGDTAQAQIDSMKADPAIVTKMMQKGTPENERYNRLLNIVGDAANRRAAAGG